MIHKPLPFRDPDRLVMLWQKTASIPQMAVSDLDYDDYRARTHALQELGGYTTWGGRRALVRGFRGPAEVVLSFVTQNYFSLLEAKPAIGRNFLPEEGRPGHDQVAVLGYALWLAQFGGSRDILNQQITLNNKKLRFGARQEFPVSAALNLPTLGTRLGMRIGARGVSIIHAHACLGVSGWV